MADEEQLAILKQGIDVWNKWRERNSSIKPDLTRADLSGLNLIGANFTWVEFNSVDLSKADLSRANLDKANLCNANLNEANLQEVTAVMTEILLAKFDGANLQDSNFSGSDLRGTSFHRAYLKGAKFIQAKLNGVNFNESDLSSAKFTKANLTSSSINNSNLDSADLSLSICIETSFVGSDLSKSNFREGDFNKADFTNAKLEKSNFSEANLEATNLTSANLYQAIFYKANLCKANLSKATLNRAELTHARLIQANLEQASLNEAELIDTKLTRANLEEASIRAGDLRGADLRWANFSKADLSNASLMHVQAMSTNLSWARLTGACLQDWNISSETILDGVICEFVYLRNNNRERFPVERNFLKEEFCKLFQKVSSVIELIFHNGVDWVAFAYSFGRIKIENEDAELSVESINNKGDGVVVIKVKISPEANKPKIHEDLRQLYEIVHSTLESSYRERLKDKDKHINQLFVLLQDSKEKLGEVPKVFLHPNQLKILQAINAGVCTEDEIAQSVGLSVDLVEYYTQQMVQEGYLHRPTFDGHSLTSQGKVAVTNSDLLLPVNKNAPSQTTILAPNSNIGFIQSGNGQVSHFSQNIGQNADDIVKLIDCLRSTAQRFPEVKREEALMHLDDLQNDISQPEKRTPARIKARLVALWAIACTLAVGIAGATDFSNNVLELADKLGVPIEFSQPQSTQQLPPSP